MSNNSFASYNVIKGDISPTVRDNHGGWGNFVKENKMKWFGREIRTGKSGKNPLQEAHRVYDTSGIIQTVKSTPLKILTMMDLYNNKIHTDRSPTLTEPHHNTIRVMETKSVYLAHGEKGRWGKRIVDEMGSLQTGNDIGVLKNNNIRRLTPIECERLQGFPDGWTEGVSDTQRYKQMGNAVTVNVISAIAKKLINYDTSTQPLKGKG